MPNPGLKPETEAAIQGMILAGEKPRVICEELNVSPSSVSRCRAKIAPELLLEMKDHEREIINGLVMQQLEVSVEASIAVASQALDPKWREKQRAGELATFYGVVTDKTIRLYEASENANIALAKALQTGDHDYTGEDGQTQ